MKAKVKTRLSDTAIQPLEDYGFFGPDSPTWRVWNHPTAVTIGFQRSVVVEELDPFLLAAVNSRRGIYTNPKLRYDRTIRYFATIALGDARSAIAASEMLMRVHAKAVGVEPVSGQRFDANDPDSQLWILLTGWHSVLLAYERYGPGKLSAADETQYWEECAIAAELQTCDPAKVPRSREGIRAYFDEMRPRLAASELTQSTMRHLLDGSQIVIDESTPAVAKPVIKAVTQIMGAATVALMPQYMRQMAGIRQSKAADIAAIVPTKVAMRTLATPLMGMQVLKAISPSTIAIAGPAIHGIAPLNPVTVTPSEAREKYGNGLTRLRCTGSFWIKRLDP